MDLDVAEEAWHECRRAIRDAEEKEVVAKDERAAANGRVAEAYAKFRERLTKRVHDRLVAGLDPIRGREEAE